ncbi:MAG: MBL fold metallo-hydrolase [Synergistaceae bacterium]|nr:MBL fold metallo-hydrolase [Synergistaceae bacterium]
MRYSIFCLFFVVMLITSFFCSAAWAAGDNVAEFKVGKASVWAIADSTGERDMSVFSATPEVISQYAPSGKCPSATMVFLVITGGETILIDAGNGTPSGDRASRLGEGLKHIGVAPEEITKVLITHMHGDHIGGLVRDGEKAFPSARVLSSRIEYDFWTDEKSPELFPNRKAGFEMARSIMELYGAATGTFEFDSEVAPGITAIDARGHTPGNTLFLLESEGEKLLFWSDLVHAAALQFPRPEYNASYDMDPDESAAARIRFMEKAAVENLPIAGVHLPFPAVGTVEKNPEGGYLYKTMHNDQ